MFTVEHLFDSTVVVCLDKTGQMEDVEFIFDEFGVWVRQFDDTQNEFDLVFIQQNQWESLMLALNLPAGSYVTKEKT